MAPIPRILVVDDDPIIARLVSTMLLTKGYATAGVVSTGEESVLKAAELAPDLVIMDVNLAGAIDGMDAAHYIFQLFQYPIIFITGVTEEELLERAKYSRPHGIVFKPFTAIALSTNVDLALYNHANRTCEKNRFPAGDPKILMDLFEAVILTDKKGRIIIFNTYAAWFLDLKPEQIMMKYWRDVLMMINDQTREELKDPVADAARNMTATMYDTNAAVVTTTSKTRKARISVRAIKDDHDRFLAVLMSIKEKVPGPGA